MSDDVSRSPSPTRTESSAHETGSYKPSRNPSPAPDPNATEDGGASVPPPAGNSKKGRKNKKVKASTTQDAVETSDDDEPKPKKVKKRRGKGRADPIPLLVEATAEGKDRGARIDWDGHYATHRQYYATRYEEWRQRPRKEKTKFITDRANEAIQQWGLEPDSKATPSWFIERSRHWFNNVQKHKTWQERIEKIIGDEHRPQIRSVAAQKHEPTPLVKRMVQRASAAFVLWARDPKNKVKLPEYDGPNPGMRASLRSQAFEKEPTEVQDYYKKLAHEESHRADPKVVFENQETMGSLLEQSFDQLAGFHIAGTGQSSFSTIWITRKSNNELHFEYLSGGVKTEEDFWAFEGGPTAAERDRIHRFAESHIPPNPDFPADDEKNELPAWDPRTTTQMLALKNVHDYLQAAYRMAHPQDPAVALRVADIGQKHTIADVWQDAGIEGFETMPLPEFITLYQRLYDAQGTPDAFRFLPSDLAPPQPATAGVYNTQTIYRSPAKRIEKHARVWDLGSPPLPPLDLTPDLHAPASSVATPSGPENTLIEPESLEHEVDERDRVGEPRVEDERAHRETEERESLERTRLHAEEHARVEREAEERSRVEREAEERARVEAEERARIEAEERARIEAEVRARIEAEVRARIKAEERARIEAEVRARIEREAEEHARVEREAEERTRIEAEERTRIEREQDIQRQERELQEELTREARAHIQHLVQEHADRDASRLAPEQAGQQEGTRRCDENAREHGTLQLDQPERRTTRAVARAAAETATAEPRRSARGGQPPRSPPASINTRTLRRKAEAVEGNDSASANGGAKRQKTAQSSKPAPRPRAKAATSGSGPATRSSAR
ncbi:uncharacterized protein BXZ73DRAFT_106149 [Epithele typhae]|uniref:uncharacterized protein n=1 Tax=Epithele typhae TaxID=378194 RepID=UPI002008C925|nr:uncharacterized protein BXZ73DRAFT_106149 [Epithele typhae]KAH9915601.1 hypothetical protein BXZ73DRAFT_106149 [Epithele typhae]